jgi:hypothetical protein
LDVLENLALVHMRCHRLCHDSIGISVDAFIEMKKEQLGKYYFYNRSRN